MSVSSTDRKQDFTLDQVEDEFDFTFKALDETDIKCSVTTNGTTYSLTYTTDYTVSLEADSDGGIVTLVDPAVVSKGTLTVYRETTVKQESDYDDYNQFSADTLENDLDRGILIDQEHAEDLDRAITFDITSTLSGITLPEPEASTVIGWDSTATELQNYALASAGVITLQDAYDAGSTIVGNPTITGNPIITGNPAITGDPSVVGTMTLSHSTIALQVTDGDIRNVAWTDYSAVSTVTGWSSFTTKTIYYKKVGNLVFVSFTIAGTSNANNAQFTLPYTDNSSNGAGCGCIYAYDNSAEVYGAGVRIAAGTANVQGILSASTTGWTTSNTKVITGQLFYEADT